MSKERQLTYPDEQVPFLDWYDGIYDAVFVAFHPFFTIDGLKPADFASRTTVFDAQNLPVDWSLELLDELDAKQRAELADQDEQFDRVVISRGNLVTWEAICSGSGLNGPHHLNQALRTNILGLKREYSDVAAAEAMNRHCEANSIFLPTEGSLQILHRPHLSELCMGLGHLQFQVQDELFMEHPTTITAADFAQSTERWPSRLWTADMSMFVVVDWDSFFSIICLTSHALTRSSLHGFDGFWADRSTNHNWWTQSVPRPT
jgi:hypothetical protein